MSKPVMNVMISQEEIANKVKELGAAIDAHYANSDRELVLVGLLRGSVILWRIFAAPSISRMSLIS